MGDWSHSKYNDEFTDRSGFSYACSNGRHTQCKGLFPVKRTGKPCTCKCHEEDLRDKERAVYG